MSAIFFFSHSGVDYRERDGALKSFFEVLSDKINALVEVPENYIAGYADWKDSTGFSDEYYRKISKGIADAGVFVAMLSPGFFRAHRDCLLELEAFLHRTDGNTRPLIAILWQDAEKCKRYMKGTFLAPLDRLQLSPIYEEKGFRSLLTGQTNYEDLLVAISEQIGGTWQPPWKGGNAPLEPILRGQRTTSLKAFGMIQQIRQNVAAVELNDAMMRLLLQTNEDEEVRRRAESSYPPGRPREKRTVLESAIQELSKSENGPQEIAEFLALLPGPNVSQAAVDEIETALDWLANHRGVVRPESAVEAPVIESAQPSLRSGPPGWKPRSQQDLAAAEGTRSLRPVVSGPAPPIETASIKNYRFLIVVEKSLNFKKGFGLGICRGDEPEYLGGSMREIDPGEIEAAVSEAFAAALEISPAMESNAQVSVEIMLPAQLLPRFDVSKVQVPRGVKNVPIDEEYRVTLRCRDRIGNGRFRSSFSRWQEKSAALSSAIDQGTALDAQWTDWASDPETWLATLEGALLVGADRPLPEGAIDQLNAILASGSPIALWPRQPLTNDGLRKLQTTAAQPAGTLLDAATRPNGSVPVVLLWDDANRVPPVLTPYLPL